MNNRYKFYIDEEEEYDDQIKFGLILSEPEEITYSMNDKLEYEEKELPNEYLIKYDFKNIYQKYNDCSSFSVCLQKEIEDQEKIILSRLFLYYNSRICHNSNITDDGSKLSSTYSSLMSYNICDDDLWKYDNDVNQKPNFCCYIDAGLRQRIKNYSKIMPVKNNMKFLLTKNKPIVIGIPIFNCFYRLCDQRSDQIYDIEDIKGNLISYHACLIIGYEYRNNIECWKIKNSHKKIPYFWIPINNNTTILEAWIINK
jgi:hypothetical protein